ncbi:GIY-YIG nuclease family protein [Hyunsoonleella ulvae]|uniref:GIY-YIG nuclease family protein n=1 Tax=Hyunsoonleella ulvae TaxID=2799948 RepID=UPI0019395C9F|nr:GIY-YIG nuclease family protein [Hyunsoonleella ulvae]
MYYIYVLYSETYDRFYIGSSNNPWKRLETHNSIKFTTYTSKYRPWTLRAVFEAGFTRGEAEKFEKFIKKQKSRKLLEKLTDKNFILEGYLAQLVRVPHLRD